MNIRFEIVAKNEFNDFRKDVKDVFSIAVNEHFGKSGDGEVIPDKEINESLHKTNADIYYIWFDDKKVGGIVLEIDNNTHRNKVDLFYIYPDSHSKGLGYHVWKSVEAMYPQTEVWELVTPYFEKRNIHFYVNKCGFHIVEFFNQSHKPSDCEHDSTDFREEYFRFEKQMKPCIR